MPKTTKPNILFLFADQWRYDAVGCNGHAIVRTPHIDSLARDGAALSRAYSPNALCSPARASVMTGLYPHNHGQLANTGNFNCVFDRQALDKAPFTQALRAQGYRTGYAGKFHLPKDGDCAQWHFDRWHTSREYYQRLRDKGIEYDFGRDDVQRLEWGGDAPFHGRTALAPEDHHDAWVADSVIDMMDEFETQGGPFCLCAAFFGPHFPIAVPAPWDAMYDPKDVPRWPNFDEMFVNKPLVQQKELLRWNSAHLTWPDWQKVIACYWGFCSFIDAQIGRIVDALKAKGLYDDTLIVFTADHGDMLGSHRLFNKGFNMYEEDYHIPFVRKPSGGAPSQVTDGYISLVDLAPTFLDLAGADVPAMDGRSILPLLRGEPQPGRELVYCEFNGYESTLLTARMIRDDRWKYVYNPFAEDELYDMQSDPAELHNLAPLLGFKHVLRRMRALMLAKLREHGDDIVDIGTWQSNSYELTISPREA